MKPESSFGICIFNAVLAGASVKPGGKISKDRVPDVLLLLSQRTNLHQQKENKVSV